MFGLGLSTPQLAHSPSWHFSFPRKAFLKALDQVVNSGAAFPWGSQWSSSFHSLLSHINPGCALSRSVCPRFQRKQWICWAGVKLAGCCFVFMGICFCFPLQHKNNLYLSIYYGAVLGLHCCVDFPLIAESGGAPFSCGVQASRCRCFLGAARLPSSCGTWA